MSYALTAPAEPPYATVSSLGNTNPYKENNHCEPSRKTCKSLRSHHAQPMPGSPHPHMCFPQGPIFTHNPFIPNNQLPHQDNLIVIPHQTTTVISHHSTTQANPTATPPSPNLIETPTPTLPKPKQLPLALRRLQDHNQKGYLE